VTYRELRSVACAWAWLPSGIGLILFAGVVLALKSVLP
jgi:hypothetical protein